MKTKNELLGEIQRLRDELAAWRTAITTWQRLADQARTELAGPFGTTPPMNDDEAAEFLDRRTMLESRIAQTAKLQAMWISEPGQLLGAQALLQQAIDSKQIDLQRAQWLSNPDRPTVDKADRERRAQAMVDGELSWGEL